MWSCKTDRLRLPHISEPSILIILHNHLDICISVVCFCWVITMLTPPHTMLIANFARTFRAVWEDPKWFLEKLEQGRNLDTSLELRLNRSQCNRNKKIQNLLSEEKITPTVSWNSCDNQQIMLMDFMMPDTQHRPEFTNLLFVNIAPCLSGCIKYCTLLQSDDQWPDDKWSEIYALQLQWSLDVLLVKQPYCGEHSKALFLQYNIKPHKILPQGDWGILNYTDKVIQLYLQYSSCTPAMDYDFCSMSHQQHKSKILNRSAAECSF